MVNALVHSRGVGIEGGPPGAEQASEHSLPLFRVRLAGHRRL